MTSQVQPQKLQKLADNLTSEPESKDMKPSNSTTRRRKKVGIACVYCRRSHMICDENRPCQRCIKRDIGHLCHDEPTLKNKRPKKASSQDLKLDTPSSASTSTSTPGMATINNNHNSNSSKGLQPIVTASASSAATVTVSTATTSPADPIAHGHAASSTVPSSSSTAPGSGSHIDKYKSLGIYNPAAQGPEAFGYSDRGQSSNQMNHQHPQQQQQSQQQSQQQLQLQSQLQSQPNSSTINQQPFFFSEHAGSEFNSLTEFLSMIDDTDMINSINLNNDPMLHKLESTYSNNNSTTNLNGLDSTFFSPLNGTTTPTIRRLPSNGTSQLAMHNNLQQFTQQQQQQHQQQPQQQQSNAQYDFNNQAQQQQQQQHTGMTPLQTIPTPHFGSTTSLANTNQQQLPAPFISDSARDKFFLTAADPTTEISPEERLKQVINAKLEAGLLRPYNYAKGYQRLQTYMDNHMAASSRQRILKPLSTFRPGFRAIAQTLKDIDLILVEENFERMLLDYDRVFTSMAIPACLWRRTGEIYRGNKEFASLVEVSIDDLKNGKLTIYELMTEESSVNFWEKYGAIAFDKTQKAVLTSCNLRTKDGRRKQNCCFSFTIRRDRYNIPSAIVANFIPIQ